MYNDNDFKWALEYFKNPLSYNYRGEPVSVADEGKFKDIVVDAFNRLIPKTETIDMAQGLSCPTCGELTGGYIAHCPSCGQRLM